MSYSRWSTAIGFDYATAYPGLEYPEPQLQFAMLEKPERDRLLKSQRAYCSSWYVYWTVGSDDSLGRKGQLLWIGSNRLRDWNGWGCWTYGALKVIATRGRWREIPGYELCQDQRDCFNLADAVREWLAEVEDTFPEQDQRDGFTVTDAELVWMAERDRLGEREWRAAVEAFPEGESDAC